MIERIDRTVFESLYGNQWLSILMDQKLDFPDNLSLKSWLLYSWRQIKKLFSTCEQQGIDTSKVKIRITKLYAKLTVSEKQHLEGKFHTALSILDIVCKLLATFVASVVVFALVPSANIKVVHKALFRILEAVLNLAEVVAGVNAILLLSIFLGVLCQYFVDVIRFKRFGWLKSFKFTFRAYLLMALRALKVKFATSSATEMSKITEDLNKLAKIVEKF